jgi:hypothetical protein
VRHEKFAFSIAEVTDALALEVSSRRSNGFSAKRRGRLAASLHIATGNSGFAVGGAQRYTGAESAAEKPKMKYAQRLVSLAMAGSVVALGMTTSGCAGRWFETRPSTNTDTQPAAPPEMRSAAATYISSLCKMPRELRDTKVRELNEAVLPNHATISCGPGSGDGP